MPGSTLEDAYRRALAARARARADLAVACVPFLVDSMFRARKSPAAAPPKEGTAAGGRPTAGTGQVE